jgi:hypothetical protein
MVIKPLDPDRYSAYNSGSGSGSGINESGSYTLPTCEEPGAHGEVVPQEEDQPDGEEEEEQTNTQGSEQKIELNIIIIICEAKQNIKPW